LISQTEAEKLARRVELSHSRGRSTRIGHIVARARLLFRPMPRLLRREPDSWEVTNNMRRHRAALRNARPSASLARGGGRATEAPRARPRRTAAARRASSSTARRPTGPAALPEISPDGRRRRDRRSLPTQPGGAAPGGRRARRHTTQPVGMHELEDAVRPRRRHASSLRPPALSAPAPLTTDTHKTLGR
jgi:hypothetical protein